MKLKKPIPKPVQNDDLMEINQALFDVPQLRQSFAGLEQIHDEISPELHRIAGRIAEIWTENACSIDADFGNKLKKIAYPDPERIVEKINLSRINCMNMFLFGKPLLFNEIYKKQNDNKKHLKVK